MLRGIRRACMNVEAAGSRDLEPTAPCFCVRHLPRRSPELAPGSSRTSHHPPYGQGLVFGSGAPALFRPTIDSPHAVFLDTR